MDPKKHSVNLLPDQQAPTKEIIVYVCPRSDCLNFYGAPNFREGLGLREPQKHRNPDTGNYEEAPARIECPDCRIRNIRSVREPYIVTAVVPLLKVMEVNEKEAKKREEKDETTSAAA